MCDRSGKNGQAKRYFEKATTMDNNFACGWIGYGNAFAAQDETDQAKTAYRTASRLFYGNHLPALYVRHILCPQHANCPECRVLSTPTSAGTSEWNTLGQTTLTLQKNSCDSRWPLILPTLWF